MRRTRGTWVGRVCVECCVDGWWQEIFFCGCNDASARQKGFNIYSLHPLPCPCPQNNVKPNRFCCTRINLRSLYVQSSSHVLEICGEMN